MRCGSFERVVLSLAILATCVIPEVARAQSRSEGAIVGLERADPPSYRELVSLKGGHGPVSAGGENSPTTALRPTLSLADHPAVVAESNRGNHAKLGAIIGAIGGGVAGAILGAQAGEIGEGWSGEDGSRAKGALVGFIIGATSGAVVGALIGVLIP